MIKPKKINAVIIVVRDIEKSLAWYKKHFGFEKLYDVEGGILIGADGVEVVLSRAGDLKSPDKSKDACIRLFAFEITEEGLACAEKEFSEDKDIVWIDHERFKSCIISDPDGHSIELYVDKPA